MDFAILNSGQMTRTTPDLEPPLQTSTPYEQEDVWPPTYDLTCNRPIYRTDSQWNWVSNLEPSGQEAETLPLDHHVPNELLHYS
ncbi:hypothetical protein AVEN_68580-1 [Araneus ventricosus]|uniref:Uncharacterized protein n=1 Tax=Araneus ventricosus TaxID=182803 RepID=A0A4Y2FEB2_ARAVE|nr:hypothetical protein AVEN_68580-1 [Araneus ventricosus]